MTFACWLPQMPPGLINNIDIETEQCHIVTSEQQVARDVLPTFQCRFHMLLVVTDDLVGWLLTCP